MLPQATVPVSVLASLAMLSEQESQIGPGWIIGTLLCGLGLQLTIHNTRTRTSAFHLFPWTEVNSGLPERWRDRIKSLKESLK